MWSVRLCSAIAAVAFIVATGAAVADCVTSPSVTPVQRVLEPVSKDPKHPTLDLCLGKMVVKIVNKKKVTYCLQCGLGSFDPGQNTGTCVASCKMGYIWDATAKQCCTGVPDPLPVIK